MLWQRNVKSSDTGQLNKNTAFSVIKNVCAIMFPLITFPYISRILGPENTGKINFSASIVSYFSLIASLGINTYALRECAAVRFEKNKLETVANQIFSINVLSAMLSYAALVIVLMTSDRLLPYRYLIIIQSLTILFTTAGTDWLNTAMSDFKYITVRTLFFQVLSMVLMFTFVHQKEDYVKYLYISVLAAGGANVVNIFYRKRYCKINFTRNMDFWHHLKPILIIFAIVISQTIFVSTDTTILGIMHGDFEVGLYGVSAKIYGIVNTLVVSVATVVLPELSELFAKKEYEKIKPVVEYSMKTVSVLGIPSIIGIMILAEEIVYTIAGAEYIGAASSLRILSLSLVFSFLAGLVINVLLLPAKKDKVILTGSITGAILNLIFNLIFIPKYGQDAAAFTTVLSNAALFFVCLPFSDKVIEMKGIFEMIKVPFIGTACMAFAVLVIKEINCSIYIKAIVSMILGVIVYISVLLIMKDEFAVNYKNQVKRKIMSLRKR